MRVEVGSSGNREGVEELSSFPTEGYFPCGSYLASVGPVNRLSSDTPIGVPQLLSQSAECQLAYQLQLRIWSVVRLWTPADTSCGLSSGVSIHIAILSWGLPY